MPTLEELSVAILGFKEGFLPIRVGTINEITYYYDFKSERQNFAGIPSQTFTPLNQLSSQILNNTDLLYYTLMEQLRVVRIGIAPVGLRVYFEYPTGNNVSNLVTFNWGNTYPQFGFTKGYESPFLEPSEATEFLLVPSTHVSFDVYNETTTTVNPMWNINIKAFRYAYLTNAQYIFDIINGEYPNKPFSYTIGSYNQPSNYSNVKSSLMQGAPPNVIPYDIASVNDIKRVWGGFK